MSALAQLLERRAREHADKPLFIEQGGHRTYRQVFEDAGRWASSFAARVPRGETAALVLPSGAPFAAAFFGAQLAGLRVLTLAPQLAAREVDFLLRHCQCRAVVADGRVAELAEGSDFERGARKASGSSPDVLLPTSGSTANPKVVALAPESLLANVAMWRARYGVTEDDVIVSPLSLFHSFGLTACLLTTIDAGATLSLPGTLPADVVSSLEEHGGTILVAVSSFYGWLLRSQAPDLPRLRVALSGACTLPREVADGFARAWGRPVHQTYGLTEASPVVTGNPLDDNRLGTVGTALAGLELRIDDDELLVRGSTVMRGYAGNDAATRAVLDPSRGWLRTGDCARIDDDGFVTLLGRKKDLIVRAGAKIFPDEVEEVLALYDDVLESAVVGVPDPTYEEIPVAFVVAREGRTIDPRRLIDHCRGGLAAYKVPRAIRFVTALPRNANGKVLKRLLRESAT